MTDVWTIWPMPKYYTASCAHSKISSSATTFSLKNYVKLLLNYINNCRASLLDKRFPALLPLPFTLLLKDDS